MSVDQQSTHVSSAPALHLPDVTYTTPASIVFHPIGDHAEEDHDDDIPAAAVMASPCKPVEYMYPLAGEQLSAPHSATPDMQLNTDTAMSHPKKAKYSNGKY